MQTGREPLVFLSKIGKQSWVENIVNYCKQYNIPIDYLSDTLYEPKVIPMVRGKAFEFSTFLVLKKLLNPQKWKVEKLSINAQLGYGDVDVLLRHLKTKKEIRVECKLAKKGGYRLFPDGHSELLVKCMRSRTLGPEMIARLSPKLKIPEGVLGVHNDQYLPEDFDVVITSIGNAFYRTDKETGIFEWKPNPTEDEFLKSLVAKDKVEGLSLKNYAFNKMYVALSKDLFVSKKNKIGCTRKKCSIPDSCGFIPNYPRIVFQVSKATPNPPWFEATGLESLIKELL